MGNNNIHNLNIPICLDTEITVEECKVLSEEDSNKNLFIFLKVLKKVVELENLSTVY